jgi:4-hydroxybutyrate CoA-transferase
MFSDGVLPLIEKGIINGQAKKIHRGKIVSSFAMGSQKLYDFMDDNPEVLMLDVGHVNDTTVIRKNKKVTAINSALEVDLTGQVCADSIGTDIFSGVGGQMDFIRGASLSEGGKPIIALPSTTKSGISKLVPTLKVGAGVVTTRAHVHYVVTEYGIADLYGKNIAQRAKNNHSNCASQSPRRIGTSVLRFVWKVLVIRYHCTTALYETFSFTAFFFSSFIKLLPVEYIGNRYYNGFS